MLVVAATDYTIFPQGFLSETNFLLFWFGNQSSSMMVDELDSLAEGLLVHGGEFALCAQAKTRILAWTQLGRFNVPRDAPLI